MTEKQHETMEVNLIKITGRIFGREAVVVEFAIAGDGCFAFPGLSH
jgi:hypothetical protein